MAIRCLYKGSFILLLVVISGCSFLYEDSSESGQSSELIDVSQAEEPWEMVDFQAVNQFNEPISNESLKGEWWLTKTIFTRCPTVCMTMTPNMSILQETLENEGINLQIVSFTVDPEFDTPERLEDYGQSYAANFDSWHFLTGYSKEDIQELALDSLKAQVQDMPEQSDIIHPTRFFLINPEGIVYRMYSGEDSFDLDVTVDDIKELTGL